MLAEYIQAIKDMCEVARISGRTLGGVIDDFSIDIGLHQGSTLNPFLFTIVMDELTRGIPNEIP